MRKARWGLYSDGRTVREREAVHIFEVELRPQAEELDVLVGRHRRAGRALVDLHLDLDVVLVRHRRAVAGLLTMVAGLLTAVAPLLTAVAGLLTSGGGTSN